MKKKLTVVIIVVLLLVIGAASAAISFAVWDNRQDDVIIEIVGGDNNEIKLEELAFKEDRVLRPKSDLNSTKHSHIITVYKFKVSIKEFDYAGFSFGAPMMAMSKDNIIDASQFMEATLWLDGNKLTNADKLVNNGIYEIRLAFTVLAESDLLKPDMQGKPVTVSFNLAGEKAAK